MTYRKFFSRYIYDRRSDRLSSTRFGAIYKATDRKKGSELCLRLMTIDDADSHPTLRDEIELANSLPQYDAVVRYTGVNRFEEATGYLDCAIMPYFPLGTLRQVLEDWKLDNNERRQLRDDILAAASFLRDNGVTVGNLDPESIFISQDDDRLLPHFINIGFTEPADEDAFTSQVSELLPVDPEPEEPEEPEQLEQLEVPDEADESGDTGSDSRKWWLLVGVAVTWIAIIGLIYAVHIRRNSPDEPDDTPKADTISAPIYPADEYAKEEATRADSIAKARQDSIAAFKADSIAYAKKVAAEKKAKSRVREQERKREIEKDPAAEEHNAEHAAPAVAPTHTSHPSEPAE